MLSPTVRGGRPGGDRTIVLFY